MIGDSTPQIIRDSFWRPLLTSTICMVGRKISIACGMFVLLGECWQKNKLLKDIFGIL